MYITYISVSNPCIVLRLTDTICLRNLLTMNLSHPVFFSYPSNKYPLSQVLFLEYILWVMIHHCWTVLLNCKSVFVAIFFTKLENRMKYWFYVICGGFTLVTQIPILFKLKIIKLLHRNWKKIALPRTSPFSIVIG